MDIADTPVAITVQVPETSKTGSGRDEPEPCPSVGATMIAGETVSFIASKARRYEQLKVCAAAGRRGRRRSRVRRGRCAEMTAPNEVAVS